MRLDIQPSESVRLAAIARNIITWQQQLYGITEVQAMTNTNVCFIRGYHLL